ncbi:MAG TPA: hypothetical protein VMY06_12140 [Sedimentisphaerales bacterium]|nr:hypothetical protein [Sedimentisphaerales bacterium]
MDELTGLQERGLLLIDRYIKEHGQAPTRRELTELLVQKSTNGVNQILQQSEKRSYIKLDPPRKKRNIKILRLPQKQLALFAEGGILEKGRE